METLETSQEPRRPLGDRLLALSLQIDWELIAYAAILLVAVVSRFYDLGTRVMSHDESLHTYFSWKLIDEGNFQHSPLMHGPFQFHVVALSYFLFGVTDATARFPAAIASILSVALVIPLRRWLGRVGALIAAALMTVSPFMLYYGRYVRNEALVVLFAMLTIYAVFRYFEDRQARWLYLLAASLALHFATKETAFIYTAQLMLFLGLMLSWRFLRARWEREGLRLVFGVGLLIILVATFVGGAGIYADSQMAPAAEGAQTLEPADPTGAGPALEVGLHPLVTTALVMIVLGALIAMGAAVASFGDRLRTDFPALDVLLIAGTFVLPQLAAFPANILGWDPLAYQDTVARLNTSIAVGVLSLIAVAVGMTWNWRRWLIAAGVFFGIFGLFYTTVLTYPDGFFTGLVGSLGYWLEQHGVNRGSQPLYYYLLIQVPIYEFLPALGALLAGAFGLRRLLDREQGEGGEEVGGRDEEASAEFPVLLFLGYWSLTSFLAYTIAGERMPWLTVHITLPFILIAGWAIGRLFAGLDWERVKRQRGWLIAALGLVALVGTGRALGYLLGTTPPFAGPELDQLAVTSGFLLATALALGAMIGLIVSARGWSRGEIFHLGGVTAFGLLFVLTARTAFRAAYINYDRAEEFLVYAHSAPGVKTVLDQVEELSRRTTDGMNIDIGYDDDVSWPYSWYLRDFTNAHYYAGNPTRDLTNYPVVIAGNDNWGEVESILRNRYYSFEYIRMWWPMQEYFGLTWDRVWGAIRSPAYRAALWEIWFDRDYDAYGDLIERDFALENWTPSDEMKLFIRKDTAALIWDYGVGPQALEEVSVADPYEEGTVDLAADQVIGTQGSALGEFQSPRDIAVGPEGDLYVADTGNHRIVRLSPEGEPEEAFGQFGGAEQEGGGPYFNEPWGLAVAPDGSLYVADTWNNRVQHLSSEGEVLATFGSYGQGETLQAFWGPRDVAVDDEGRLYVADTGNKRIVVFEDGGPLTSFGGAGVGSGQLDEPVGLAIGPAGRIHVADTWNQRVQVFEATDDAGFLPVLEWPIEGWYGQSLNNKPYLAVSDRGIVCTSDPEGFRILCFNDQGEFLKAWGQAGEGANQFGLPVGVDFQGENLWVVDSENHRLMRFGPAIP